VERHNNSLEATWDAPRFACDGAILLSWGARAGEIPGASPLGFASGCFAKLEAVSLLVMDTSSHEGTMK
jgi:hypothetical protein